MLIIRCDRCKRESSPTDALFSEKYSIRNEKTKKIINLCKTCEAHFDLFLGVEDERGDEKGSATTDGVINPIKWLWLKGDKNER